MSMSVADRLRSYSQAYPIEVFPKCNEEKLKDIHKYYPTMGSSIYAESGRNFARQALEGAVELDRLEAENERLLKEKLKAYTELFTANEEIKKLNKTLSEIRGYA